MIMHRYRRCSIIRIHGLLMIRIAVVEPSLLHLHGRGCLSWQRLILQEFLQVDIATIAGIAAAHLFLKYADSIRCRGARVNT